MGQPNVLSVTIASAVLVALGGCTLNDRFSEDAVEYNRQAEQVQDQVLLLNILRASKRRPLEFSGVQTITGTGSATGGISLSLPLRGKTPGTLTPSITRSAGPSVAVGVVDTQDFYQGLLKPISTEYIDLFVQRGIPRLMLFDLFFARVEVRHTDVPKETMVIRNDVAHADEFARFQTLMQAFVQANLTTEKRDKPKSFGPVMTAREALEHPGLAAKLATASLDLKEIGWCDLDEQETSEEAARLADRAAGSLSVALKDPCKHLAAATASDKSAAQQDVNRATGAAGLPRILYRAQKADTDYRLCFDLPPTAEGLTICHAEQKSGAAKAEAPNYKFPAQSSAAASGTAATAICQALRSERADFPCSGQIELGFTVRSTYGVIYYLGEIVRQEIYPDRYPGVSPAYPAWWTVPTNPQKLPLFEATQDGEASSAFVNVDYDGYTYGVPNESGGSPYEVLDLVTELIALNKSAKDLPASSVITAVGVP